MQTTEVEDEDADDKNCGRGHGRLERRAAGPPCSGSPVRLGPTTGPRRTVASIHTGWVCLTSSGNLVFVVMLLFSFWLFRFVLVVRPFSVVSFHAGGVTPSRSPERQGVRGRNPFRSGKREGVTSPATNHMDRGAPARQGAGSYPAPTSAVPSRQSEAA